MLLGQQRVPHEEICRKKKTSGWALRILRAFMYKTKVRAGYNKRVCAGPRSRFNFPFTSIHPRFVLFRPIFVSIRKKRERKQEGAVSVAAPPTTERQRGEPYSSVGTRVFHENQSNQSECCTMIQVLLNKLNTKCFLFLVARRTAIRSRSISKL